MNRELLAEIVAAYGLEGGEIRPIHQGQTNRTHHLATPAGDYIITLFLSQSLTHVMRVGRLLRWLTQHGLPVPQRIRTPSRDTVICIDRQLITVKTFIAGNVCRHLSSDMLHQVCLLYTSDAADE